MPLIGLEQINKLSINASKTYHLVFHTLSKHMEVPDHNNVIKLADCIIKQADNMKFLGLLIDEKLEWQQHTSLDASKIAWSLYILNSVKSLVLSRTLKTLYYSLVYTHLNYGIIHWSNTYKYNLNKIISHQTKAVKAVSKSKKSVTPSTFSNFHIVQFYDISQLGFGKICA